MKDVFQGMNFVHDIENYLIKIFEETLIELNEYLSPAELLMTPRTSVKANGRYFLKPALIVYISFNLCTIYM